MNKLYHSLKAVKQTKNWLKVVKDTSVKTLSKKDCTTKTSVKTSLNE